MASDDLFDKIKLLTRVVASKTPPDKLIDLDHELIKVEINSLFDQGLAEIAERENEAQEVLNE